MRPASRGALHLDDVLARRTHIAVEARNRSLMAAKGVAELAAQELFDATAVAARRTILDRFGA
jgi:glycerol-3-phosphate dehydrogenase